MSIALSNGYTGVMTLPDKIQTARTARGWTRELLAVYSGISASTIGRIERGQLTPRVGTIIALARVLDLDPQELALDIGVTIHIPPDKWS
jgi:transcriptional regulator with XRE-family HTH domain